MRQCKNITEAKRAHQLAFTVVTPLSKSLTSFDLSGFVKAYSRYRNQHDLWASIAVSKLKLLSDSVLFNSGYNFMTFWYSYGRFDNYLNLKSYVHGCFHVLVNYSKFFICDFLKEWFHWRSKRRFSLSPSNQVGTQVCNQWAEIVLFLIYRVSQHTNKDHLRGREWQ